MVERLVEPFRKAFLRRTGRRTLLALARAITLGLYPPIWTVYRLPLRFLPFHEYFANFRRLSFGRNVLNVFDKLNAPQVQFIDRARIGRWFGGPGWRDVHISAYKGVSWRGSATRSS